LVQILINDSHTCYQGVREVKHPWGYGCGACAACELRKSGFERWKHGESK
jgi:7-cyano-7-deazaguanine synthase